MSWDNALVLIIIGITAFFVLRWLYRKTKPSCHAGCCGGCQSSNASTATIPTKLSNGSEETVNASSANNQ